MAFSALLKNLCAGKRAGRAIKSGIFEIVIVTETTCGNAAVAMK